MKFVERQVTKFKMKVHPSEGGIHKHLRDKPHKPREPELLYVLRNEVKPGMTVMDLGANIGYISLLLADLIGENGLLYAIEPDPHNIELLKDNIKTNKFDDRTEVYHLALSNKRGHINFFIGKSSNLGGLVKTKNTHQSPITVNTTTIDSFLSDKKYPDLIKMDIEGSEVEVLDGINELLNDKEFKPKIIMELHPTLYSNTRSLFTQMMKLLDSGFKTKYVISAGVVQPDKFKMFGYEPINHFSSLRGLYDCFTDDHMLEVCCFPHTQWMPSKKKYSPKIARFVMIERT